jgi:hypothetical protein
MGVGAIRAGEHPFSQKCGVVEGERALGLVRMEYDAIHDQVESVQGDYLSRLRTFTTVGGALRSLTRFCVDANITCSCRKQTLNI